MLHVLTAMLLATAQDMSPEAVANSVRVLPPNTCPTQGGSGDIVVCGRRDPDRYRIPEQLRPTAPEGRSEQSWGAQLRTFMDEERLDGQTVGQQGYLKHGQQIVREWRADRARIAREQRELEEALDRQ